MPSIAKHRDLQTKHLPSMLYPEQPNGQKPINNRKNTREMTSTAHGARSTEGSGSAGAQSNRRNGSEKPSDGKNKVLPSPTRAHDPQKRQLKLPPGVALVTGNQHAVKSVALDFVDGIIDPNLARYVQKDRSRSVTPPDSPWGEMETEMTAAENAAVSNTEGSEPEGSWTEVVKGNRQGSQWPKPNHTNWSAEDLRS